MSLSERFKPAVNEWFSSKNSVRAVDSLVDRRSPSPANCRAGRGTFIQTIRLAQRRLGLAVVLRLEHLVSRVIDSLETEERQRAS